MKMKNLLLIIVVWVVYATSLQLPGSDNIQNAVQLTNYDPFPSPGGASQFLGQVFDLEYSQTADGSCNQSMIIPKGCSASCDTSMDFSSELIQADSLNQIVQKIHANLHISATWDFFTGSTSDSFQRMTQTVLDKQQVYFQVKAELRTWVLNCDGFTGLNLSTGFQQTVKNMPTDCTESELCQDLVSQYGQAFASQINLGGRFFLVFSQTLENYQYLQNQSIDLNAAAAVHLASQIGAQSHLSISKSDLQKFQNRTTFSQILSFGGDTQMTWSAWAPTVQIAPRVLSVEKVITLDQLLSPIRFPNDPKIQQKSKAMLQAMLISVNTSVSCPNECSGNGKCQVSSLIHIGVCACDAGWGGIDCSQKLPVYPVGTLCGLAVIQSNGTIPYQIPCDGKHKTCPSGFEWQHIGNWSGAQVLWYKAYSCVSTQSQSQIYTGILCGSSIEHSCGTDSVYDGTCPAGYQYTAGPNGVLVSENCYVENTNAQILSGWMCGSDLVKCENQELLYGCPIGYTENTFAGSSSPHTCFKN